MTSDRIRGLSCGLAAALIWGGFPVMTRLGATRSGLDMYDITFIRFAVAALLTFPALLRRPLPEWKLTAVLTLGIGAPYILVVSDGLTRAPVALFAVLTPTTMVLCSAGLGACLLKERLTVSQGIGMAAILAGSTLAALNFFGRSTNARAASALFVVGGLLWAIYTVSAKRSKIDAFTATGMVSAASLLVYGPFYLGTKGFALFQRPWQSVLEQAFYQGVLVSVAALYFYSRAVSLLGASIGASFAALVPAIAMIEAALFLGETPTWQPALGLTLSVAGIAAVLIGPRPIRSSSVQQAEAPP